MESLFELLLSAALGSEAVSSRDEAARSLCRLCQTGQVQALPSDTKERMKRAQKLVPLERGASLGKGIHSLREKESENECWLLNNTGKQCQ